jgi:hypothetical protein
VYKHFHKLKKNSCFIIIDVIIKMSFTLSSHEIGPLNPPSSGVYSYKDGYPIINFQIGAQPGILVGSSVKLNATARIRNEVGLTPNNFNALQPLAGERSGNVSNRAGIYSAFSQLTISTLTNQTIENIRHYSNYVANQLNMNRSQADMDTNSGVLNLISSRSGTTARSVNVDRSVSLHLASGYFGENQSLGLDGSAGLLIALTLSSDSSALTGYFDSFNTLQNLTSAGWIVELSNVSLSFDTVVPEMVQQAAMMKPQASAQEFVSISTIYSDITSSDATLNINLNKSMVLGVQSIFQPTNQINNYNFDSFAMGKLKVNGTTNAELYRVAFLRGSQLAPYQDDIDVETESVQGTPLTDLYIPSINAFQPYNKLERTMMSSQSEIGITTSTSILSGADVSNLTLPDINQSNFSISTTQDPYEVGIGSLKNQTYGLHIVSNLGGSYSNGVFTFVRAKNILRRSAMGQVQIIS